MNKKELKKIQKEENELNEVSGGIKEELNRLKEEKEKKLVAREDSWKKWDNLFKNNN